MFFRRYSLTKSHKILRKGVNLLKKRGVALSPIAREQFTTDLRTLDHVLLQKDRKSAEVLAKKVESAIQQHFPKTSWDSFKEIVGALIFAIVIAFCIRQFWFELYEVPTGSMRPTVQEKDRLLVSKTTFGIHIPFTKKLWLFKEDRVQRGSIIVFTVENMELEDPNTKYFYIFPGKKRLIKRCMAKGGDTIYFYGGKIYGIDRDGNPFYELSDSNLMKKGQISTFNHVPYINFQDRTIFSSPIATSVYAKSTLKWMNKEIARLQFDGKGNFTTSFFNNQKWVTPDPVNFLSAHKQPAYYSELWGNNNYAMARILSQEEAQNFYPEKVQTNHKNFLELRHSPNGFVPKPEMLQNKHFVLEPTFLAFQSIMPLDTEHMEKIRQNMTTSRFVVTNQRAFHYSEAGPYVQPIQFDVILENVPDGTYEFERGVLYRIHTLGVRSKPSLDHPLYSNSSDLIRKLFNLGISFNTLYDPMNSIQPFLPHRYAFYRDGNLFVMDTLLFEKDTPFLEKFVNKELQKQKSSESKEPYIAFVDRGSPIKDGKLDIEFIKNFGLKIPENHLLALGDNYPSSSDSRDFGFVPYENLRGAPSFIFWPPQSRFGAFPQPPYPWVTLPNIIIWSLVLIIICIWRTILYKRHRESLFKDE